MQYVIDKKVESQVLFALEAILDMKEKAVEQLFHAVALCAQEEVCIMA